MANFLIITGMILWGLATVGVLAATFFAGTDVNTLREGVVVWTVGVALFAASTAGIILTINANGWFDEELPPDGCYHLSRDTTYLPVSTGKVTTLTPVEDVQFMPISCPGGGS